MSRPLRYLAEIALALAVMVAAGTVFFNVKAKIDSDEVEWIGTTRFFQLYLVEHDVSPQSWPDDYWTRTQPMVVRYVIGGWLWLRGYDLKALDPTYDYTRNAAENRRAGLAPPDDLLADARTPSRALATLAVLLLYLLVRAQAGPVGGIVGGLGAATLATGSPYLQEHLVRAKAEATLMALLLGALLVGAIGLKRAGAVRWPRPGCGVAAGLLLGLALGAKLTAILAMAAVAAWGIWACAADWLPRLRAAPPPAPLPAAAERGNRPIRLPSPSQWGGAAPWAWSAAVLVTSGLVFLLSNPFLWPDPIGRTWLLFDNRREEMARQQVNLPSRAVYGLDRRIALVWDRSVLNDAFGPSRLNLPVEAVLTVVGAGWLALRAATRRPTDLTLVFLWSGSIWVGVTVGLGFLLQHYFVPTALTADLLAGLAIGWAAQAAWTLGRRLAGRYLARRRATASPTPVTTTSREPGALGLG